MENNELGNLYISGSGRCSGGKFRSVKILGSGKIVGDIECEDFKISGSGNVEGAIVTNEFKISGSGKVESDVTCTDGVISGSGHILGKVSSKNFKISGGGKIGGKLIGENIYISGIGAVEQDIEADKVEVSGGIRVEGMLNADMVNMELNGSSQVKEIRSEEHTSELQSRQYLVCRLLLEKNTIALSIYHRFTQQGLLTEVITLARPIGDSGALGTGSVCMSVFVLAAPIIIAAALSRITLI